MSEAQEPQEEGANFKATGHGSPGHLLKQERERQGVSLEEAALQLNLRPAVVRGIEADRYEEVPIPAYRRGYLRAYARYMHIDESQVVEAYDVMFGREDLERKVTPVHSTPPPSRIGAWIFKLVTVLVILGLIGLTLLWWQSREGDDLLGLAPPEPVNMETADIEPAGQGSDESIPTTQPDNVSPAPPPPPEEPSQFGLISEQDEAAADAAEGAAALNGEATDTEQTDTLETDTLAEQSDEPVTPAAPSNMDRLLLTFNEQSWTEIFDADNQRVLVGLQPADSEAVIEGQPPFRLTIGNASGVEITYRGETVDLENRTASNNVARLTLGE